MPLVIDAGLSAKLFSVSWIIFHLQLDQHPYQKFRLD
jgi:hypothetical protein